MIMALLEDVLDYLSPIFYGLKEVAYLARQLWAGLLRRIKEEVGG